MSTSQTAVESALAAYGEENVKGYMQPFADLFGANLNSGYYRTAAVPVAGFHFEFDIIVMGAMVGDAEKKFNATAPSGFTPATFESATIFGDEGNEVTDSPTSLTYRGADGVFNTTMMPMATPQIKVGSLYGTEFLGRFGYVPALGDNFESTTLWAIGARHNLNQWFGTLPLDLSAAVYYSSLSTGELMKFNGLMVGAQASKEFGILTVYGGLGYQSSTLTLKYESTVPSAPGNVEIKLDGKNNFAFTAGAGLSFDIFKIFADINVGSVTNLSGGIGFGG
jgi:opacity protein-like surface antigen